MTASKQLAELARRNAAGCAIDRRAWLCIAVVLDTTTSAAAARKALDDIPVPGVRDRAGQLLGQLTEGNQSDEADPTPA